MLAEIISTKTFNNETDYGMKSNMTLLGLTIGDTIKVEEFTNSTYIYKQEYRTMLIYDCNLKLN